MAFTPREGALPDIDSRIREFAGIVNPPFLERVEKLHELIQRYRHDDAIADLLRMNHRDLFDSMTMLICEGQLDKRIQEFEKVFAKSIGTATELDFHQFDAVSQPTESTSLTSHVTSTTNNLLCGLPRELYDRLTSNRMAIFLGQVIRKTLEGFNSIRSGDDLSHTSEFKSISKAMDCASSLEIQFLAFVRIMQMDRSKIQLGDREKKFVYDIFKSARKNQFPENYRRFVCDITAEMATFSTGTNDDLLEDSSIITRMLIHCTISTSQRALIIGAYIRTYTDLDDRGMMAFCLVGLCESVSLGDINRWRLLREVAELAIRCEQLWNYMENPHENPNTASMFPESDYSPEAYIVTFMGVLCTPIDSVERVGMFHGLIRNTVFAKEAGNFFKLTNTKGAAMIISKTALTSPTKLLLGTPKERTDEFLNLFLRSIWGENPRNQYSDRAARIIKSLSSIYSRIAGYVDNIYNFWKRILSICFEMIWQLYTAQKNKTPLDQNPLLQKDFRVELIRNVGNVVQKYPVIIDPKSGYLDPFSLFLHLSLVDDEEYRYRCDIWQFSHDNSHPIPCESGVRDWDVWKKEIAKGITASHKLRSIIPNNAGDKERFELLLGEYLSLLRLFGEHGLSVIEDLLNFSDGKISEILVPMGEAVFDDGIAKTEALLDLVEGVRAPDKKAENPIFVEFIKRFMHAKRKVPYAESEMINRRAKIVAEIEGKTPLVAQLINHRHILQPEFLMVSIMDTYDRKRQMESVDPDASQGDIKRTRYDNTTA